MNGEQSFNLNQADCIKSWSDFGMEHYQNICSGKMWDVPWGSFDWSIVAVGICIFVVVGLFFLGIVADIVRN